MEVQFVLTTSSKDGRRAQHATCADCAPREIAVLADERVEDRGRPCSARDRNGRFQDTRLELDTVRRKLRHAVRDDRSREVDRLSMSSSQAYLEGVGHRKYMPHRESTTSTCA
jgi:hypothetical protein